MITFSAELPSDATRQLQFFNAKWQDRYTVFKAHCPPPWWEPGLILTPDIHAEYERFLSVDEFCNDLCALFHTFLPHQSWIPAPVQDASFKSLPDLWQSLPTHLVPRGCEIPEDDLFPLACALASPYKFGTRAARYPEQDGILLNIVTDNAPNPMTICEAACGTGQNTWHISKILNSNYSPAICYGITREPLEAWMAQQRVLPHVLETTESFSFPDSETPPQFAAGDVSSLPLSDPVDVIVLNGLIGGSAMNSESAFIRLWTCIEKSLAPNGVFMWADAFHDGQNDRRQSFLNNAPESFNKLQKIERSFVIQKG